MPASPREELTELLAYVSSELTAPPPAMRAVLLYVAAELARLLLQDSTDQELQDVLAPRTVTDTADPVQPGDVIVLPGHRSGLVLDVHEQGTLLKVRDRHQVRHVRRAPEGWVDL